ncbi:uncharacterized protein LOC115788695 [Archocentrus centrarchus]|uniref:uncharacterized protein LOC115788695 n=1 Tax=Archocentrus centrarchus TaxID=63155 RepID=UPI0011EA43FF|nr:uncharacterized protein LOC115788695 [Archocentrus centrarchus]
MAAEGIISEKLEESKVFRRNAYIIIDEMLEMSKQKTQEDTTVLVDEILHSIFFLGKINKPPISPERILGDRTDEVRALYPEPFKRCSSQLPRRSPFSCVLDMFVHLIGHKKEEDIKRALQVLISYLRKDTKSKCLFSFTICISQATENSVRYYGVSMSTSGRDAGRIMVAASCCSAWDEYVAGAVMTYFPNKHKNIDGTIRLPENVRCEAFSLSDPKAMPPCRSCVTLFSLPMNNTDTGKYPYGNCAEVESLSNLFKSNRRVKQRARPASESWTEMNKDKRKRVVLKELKRLLDTVDFKWDENFYEPKSARKTN